MNEHKKSRCREQTPPLRLKQGTQGRERGREAAVIEGHSRSPVA